MSETLPRPDWQAPELSRIAAPLREQASNALREAIISLVLPPGHRLVERELIEQLGVSRTTVREVIRLLESEGLVKVIPQRGAVVATLSPREADDLYEARVGIESLVVRRFVERAPDPAIAELRAAAEYFCTVSEQGADIQQMLSAKDRFYNVLVEGAGSPPLQQLLASLQARVRQLRATSLSQEGRRGHAAQELSDLVDAIAARDAPTAERLCTEHVRAAAQSGLDALHRASSEAP